VEPVNNAQIVLLNTPCGKDHSQKIPSKLIL